MSALGSGIVEVGSFGDAITVGDNGGLCPVDDVNVTANAADFFSAQNNTAAPIVVPFLVFFTTPTPGAVGVVSASDPRISVA